MRNFLNRRSRLARRREAAVRESQLIASLRRQRAAQYQAHVGTWERLGDALRALGGGPLNPNSEEDQSRLVDALMVTSLLLADGEYTRVVPADPDLRGDDVAEGTDLVWWDEEDARLILQALTTAGFHVYEIPQREVHPSQVVGL